MPASEVNETTGQVKIRIRMQPKQRQLWRYTERGTASWVGYGGARGSAKSHGLDAVIMLRALKYSNTVHVIFRRVYKDLLDNHIEPMLARWPVLKGWYNKTDSMIRLPNGSAILFRAGETAKDLEDVFQGKNYCTVGVDEASKLSEYELHEVIKPAVRYVGEHPIEAMLICCMNPGGIGHTFLKRIFIKRDFKKNENPDDYVYLQGHGWDNFEWVRKPLTRMGVTYHQYYYEWTEKQRFKAFITLSSYGRNLWSLPENRRKAFLFGDWDIFSGQFFDTWRDDIHVKLLKEYQRPPNAYITSAIDYGRTAIMEVQATDSYGKTVNFLEVSSDSGDPRQRAIECANALLEHELYGIDMVYDTDMAMDMKNYTGQTMTIAEQFDEVFREIMGPDRMPRTRIVSKAPTDRRGYRIGVNLAMRNALAWHVTAKGDLIMPRFFVLETCPQLIECIKNLIEDDKVPELLDFVHTNDVVDHPYDAAKMAYMEVIRPAEPKSEETAKTKWDRQVAESLGMANRPEDLVETWENTDWRHTI